MLVGQSAKSKNFELSQRVLTGSQLILFLGWTSWDKVSNFYSPGILLGWWETDSSEDRPFSRWKHGLAGNRTKSLK